MPKKTARMCALKECLSDLSLEAFSTGFRMGLYDKVMTRRKFCKMLKTQISVFEKAPDTYGGWHLNDAQKPVGPAVALAGIVLACLDHGAYHNWNIGGAIMEQFWYKTAKAERARPARHGGKLP